MEITLVLLIVFYFVFYLLRPTSKEELKRFNKKDNWSNMGFWKENIKLNIMRNIVLKFAFILMTCSPAFSADENIDMLNRLGKEINVYSKKIVNVDVGDTVNWKSVNPGHNVEFIKGGIPEGVEKFKSKYNKDTSYTFKTPGIYAYWCTPHKSMGMIGFVVVGNDKSNLDAIKKLKFYGKSTKIAEELINSL